MPIKREASNISFLFCYDVMAIIFVFSIIDLRPSPLKKKKKKGPILKIHSIAIITPAINLLIGCH